MSRRILMWLGALVATAAVTGLAVYLAMVGLDRADKLASVLALFVGIAGVVLAIPGFVEILRSQKPAPPPDEQPAPKNGLVIQNGRNNIYSTGPSQIHIGDNYRDHEKA